MASVKGNLAMRVAGLSAIAGLRSLSGPALLAIDNRAITQTKVGERLFGSDSMKIAVQALAVGEIIFDKLPIAPNRTDVLPLMARAASGALIGASLYSASKESVLKGALIGGASAIVATLVSYQLRKVLTKNVHIPDALVAMAEDAFVLSRGVAMLNAALADQLDADFMEVPHVT